MKKLLSTIVFDVALCFYVLGASAVLIGIEVGGPVADSGTGFGNVSNILTLQQTGTETGSISWNGTSDVSSGDAKNTSKTWLVSDIKATGIDGRLVILDHGSGYFTLYAHAADILIKAGDAVLSGGQGIAKVGDSVSLGGPQLYFELRHKGKPQDPLSWLRSR